MLNLYQSVRSNPAFNRLEIGDLLFAEYTCPIGEEKLGMFAHTDYLVHVVSGRKTWHTMDGDWSAEAGQTLFFKKGAAIVRQFFEVDFCLLLFFIPDGLVRETIRELADQKLPVRSPGQPLKCVARIEHDVTLTAFFQSMRAYFSSAEKPPEPVVRLKLRELITGILTSDHNPQIAAYFRSLEHGGAPPIDEIMEANFRFNLSLEEFAELSHRSLSTFKRDFRKHFEETPGRWLLRRRLEYAANLLRSTESNVTEVVFESGFEDVSHFSRVFKEKFGVTPSAYRAAPSK